MLMLIIPICFPPQLFREVRIMKLLNHPNIGTVTFLTFCYCIQYSNEVCSHYVSAFSVQMKYAHILLLYSVFK